MFKNNFILFLLLLTGYTLSAQSVRVDSFLQQLDNEAKEDKRIDMLIEYLGATAEIDPILDMQISHQILSHAKKNKDTITEAFALSEIAYDYRAIGNITKSLEYHLMANALASQTQNEKLKAITVLNMAHIYKDQSDHSKAIDLYTYVAESSKNLEYNLGQCWAYTSLSQVYLEMNQLDSALIFAQQAYELSLHEENYIKSVILQFLGSIHGKLGNKKLAVYYFKMSINESISEKSPRWQNVSYTALAKYYYDQGTVDSSMIYAKKAMAVVQNSAFSNMTIKAAKLLVEIYKDTNSDSALKYSGIYNRANDSLFSLKIIQQTQAMTFEYEFKEKEALALSEQKRKDEFVQKELQKQKFIRNSFVGGFSAVLLFAAVFFYQRNKTKKEKQRSDELLLNILPAEIAEELKEKGKADARDYDIVSILFTDFKEFTQSSEKLSAQELVSEINTCFEAFDAICSKYKVEKIKTIGDAYMAAGGLPMPADDSVKKTVLAALEMQEFICERKSEMDEQGKPAFEMRVGIHTGPVVAGIVGVKKFQYDIWGDTVNTASRVENMGESGKVNISKSTYNLIKNDPDFSFEDRGHLEAKGKGEMKMYFVSKNI